MILNKPWARPSSVLPYLPFELSALYQGYTNNSLENLVRALGLGLRGAGPDTGGASRPGARGPGAPGPASNPPRGAAPATLPAAPRAQGTAASSSHGDGARTNVMCK